MLYNACPNLTIGFQGCDEETRNKLLANPNEIKLVRKNMTGLVTECIFGKTIMHVPYNGQKTNKKEVQMGME